MNQGQAIMALFNCIDAFWIGMAASGLLIALGCGIGLLAWWAVRRY